MPLKVGPNFILSDQRLDQLRHQSDKAKATDIRWLDNLWHPEKKQLLELMYDLMHVEHGKMHTLQSGIDVIVKFDQLKQAITVPNCTYLSAEISQYSGNEYDFHYRIVQDNGELILDNHCLYGYASEIPSFFAS